MASPKGSKLTKGLLVLAIVGAVFVILGCVALIISDGIIYSQVAATLPLNKKGQTYEQWKRPKIPIYFQVWAFDITNPLEILEGKKPAVVHKGPYTYREERTKHAIRFFENGTVYYKERRSFVFDRGLSVGSDNETVTSVNLAMATVMTALRYEAPLLKELVDGALQFWKEELFVETSVHDLLWGREDNILKAIADLVKSFNVTLPITDTVGLLMGKNNTDTGEYLIHSGQRGLENFANIVSWNRQRKLSVWSSDYANTINGSLGIFFPPFVDKDHEQYIFSTDLTRSLALTFQHQTETEGIPLYKFYAPPVTFAKPSINPLNAGFCTPPGHCLPSGLLNMSTAYFGAPVVVSNPHFLFCEPEVVASVEGIWPDREAYESHLNIEPLTGITMVGARRMQINLHLHRIEGFKETDHLESVFMPVLWLNESATIPADQARRFKRQVLDMVLLLTVVKYGLVGLGGLLLLLAASLPLAVQLCPKDDTDRARARGNVQGSERAGGGRGRTDAYDEPLLVPTCEAEDPQSVY